MAVTLFRKKAFLVFALNGFVTEKGGKKIQRTCTVIVHQLSRAYC